MKNNVIITEDDLKNIIRESVERVIPNPTPQDVKNIRSEVMTRVIENGADPFITDNEKNCPLTIAFEKLSTSNDYSIIDSIVKLTAIQIEKNKRNNME